MKIRIEPTKLKALFVIILVSKFVSPADADKNQLIGFDQMADDINGTAYKLLDKLAGETYQLAYNQAGDYQLKLFPESLFEVVKTADSTFLITIKNPKAMYEKHQQETFKINWLITEIVDSED